jgi:hypothetical protein
MLMGAVLIIPTYLYAIDSGSQQARSAAYLISAIMALLLGALNLLLPERATNSRRQGLFWLCLGLVLVAQFVL